MRGQSDGVADPGSAPGAGHRLHREAVTADSRAHVLLVLLHRQVGSVAQLAHQALLVVRTNQAADL